MPSSFHVTEQEPFSFVRGGKRGRIWSLLTRSDDGPLCERLPQMRTAPARCRWGSRRREAGLGGTRRRFRFRPIRQSTSPISAGRSRKSGQFLPDSGLLGKVVLTGRGEPAEVSVVLGGSRSPKCWIMPHPTLTTIRRPEERYLWPIDCPGWTRSWLRVNLCPLPHDPW
jgi:hypothetical protein